MTPSHSAAPCWSSPTQRLLCLVIGIGGYLKTFVNNLNAKEISLRMRGLRRSRLNSDANGSPRIAITPGSTDLIGDIRSLTDRHLEGLFDKNQNAYRQLGGARSQEAILSPAPRRCNWPSHDGPI